MQADTAAPIQSVPQQYSTPPTSYAAQAAPVATTSQWVPATPPAPGPQAQVTTAPYAPIQSYPQAQPTAENPYKEAFNRVVSLLSSPVPFPFQGQQSAGIQGIDPGSFSSQQSAGYSSNSVAPIYPSSPGYSPSYSPTSQEITQQQLLANGVSPASLEVIDHFGADAPAVLNEYSCTLEDALITRYSQLEESVGLLRELAQEHQAYEAILTDPDILADYTCEFFGPNGPYPVEQETDDGGFYDAEGYYYDPTGYYDLDGTYYYDDYYNSYNPEVYNGTYDNSYDYGYGQETYYDPNSYGYDSGYDTGYETAYDNSSYLERPSLPVPPHPENTVDGQSFWNNFGNVAERDPANAWRYLSAAQRNPNVFRQKLLVMD